MLLNISDSRLPSVYFMYGWQRTALLVLHGELAFLQLDNFQLQTSVLSREQVCDRTAHSHTKPGAQVQLQLLGPKLQNSDTTTAPPPCLLKQGDSSHPFKETTVFSLNIKASIYIKNSCKRQERQESDFRPNKCIAGNEALATSRPSSRQPVFSQHLAGPAYTGDFF